MIALTQHVGSADKQTVASVSKHALQIGSLTFELTSATRVELIAALLKDLPANVRKQHFENVTAPATRRRKAPSMRQWGEQYAQGN